MTRYIDPAHAVVRLNATINEEQFATARKEIADLLDTPGIKSVTLRVNAISGMIPTACDMHEHVSDLRRNSPIPLRVLAAGCCGASALLVILAFDRQHRCYTKDTMFVLQKPFFEPLYPRRSYEADGDISADKARALTDERFYRLFGAGLNQSAAEARQLFVPDRARRILSLEKACALGIVTEFVPSDESLAA